VEGLPGPIIEDRDYSGLEEHAEPRLQRPKRLGLTFRSCAYRLKSWAWKTK